MSVLLTILKISGIIFLSFITIIILLNVYLKIRAKLKKIIVKKRDASIRAYLKNFNSDEKLAIVDETPREVFIGDRFYLLKPLKYRQYTRLCVLFAKTLEKLNGLDIDLAEADKSIGTIIEHSEDEFFKAVACVLFFSNNQYEDNEKKIFAGMQEEYKYLKNNATITEISRILEIIAIQNDIQRALKSFNIVNIGKKKVVM